MAKYVYPAIFTEEEVGYSVNFPDVENCYTSGDSLIDAMEMASDVLAMTLTSMEREKLTIPEATPLYEFKQKKNNFATLILCDTTDYPLVDYPINM